MSVIIQLMRHLTIHTAKVFSLKSLYISQVVSFFYETEFEISGLVLDQLTEVGHAPLIHFQKLFLNKVFYILKLVRKFQFYIWLTISGCKSVTKGQKKLKKGTNLSYVLKVQKNSKHLTHNCHF